MFKKSRKIFSLFLSFCMLVCLMPGNIVSAKEDKTSTMKVNDSGYLDKQGFSVFLYNSTFDAAFVDQKNTAMELILHGNRIATNGDVRLVPTPEQWDAVATLKSRNADKKNNCLTANLAFSDYNMSYSIKVVPEKGGIKVSLNLDNPLPDSLAGRAGFNLEFLPSIYVGKIYQVDGKSSGIFPSNPYDQMTKVEPPANDPLKEKQLSYLKEWDEMKGYTQPLPMATGSKMTLAAEDPLNRISIKSDSEPLMLYDGRNKAQNGWFVLRTLIPSGKTKNAIVWHIQPNEIKNWTREPNVAHSQVGYTPNQSKVAVIELDPKYKAPKTAKLVRLEDNGSYQTAYKGKLTKATKWLRYNYSKFDFSSVKKTGMYAIEYAGKRTALFPINKNVYDKTWQQSLDCYLAEQMDHVSVRDGYRLWHGVSNLDDARQAPANIKWFDGWSMGENLDSPYQPGEHIPGLNVGGWYDAGDFDIQTGSQCSVIQDLALAYKVFNLNYDNLTVDEDARSVEMRRPDGVPDAVQQVKHGALQLLAQIDAVGHVFPVIEYPNLREYTHLGDGASDTDGLIYSSDLGINDRNGNYSGKPDDRWAFTTKTTSMQFDAAAALAASADVLKGWDNAMAKKCMDNAVKIWKEEPHSDGTDFNAMMQRGSEWSAAIQLLIASNGDEVYKKRIKELYPTMLKIMDWGGWQAVRILPYMDNDFKNQLETAVKNYVVQLNKTLSSSPFGVPETYGMWGGTSGVCDLGIRMYLLHKAYPKMVNTDYTLRAVNYILGTHPVTNSSWVSGVGTQSKQKAYGNNRADNTYIPGGVVPGYVVIKPDFPECIEDFGFLWYENEYCITDASKWILAANAAQAIAAEE